MTSYRTNRVSWLLPFIVLVIALVTHRNTFVYAQEHEGTCTSIDDQCNENDIHNANEIIPEFKPTTEWQDILPGQAVPPGLHIRLNFATGKREAKILTDDDVDASNDETQEHMINREVVIGREHRERNDQSVTVVTDVTGDIDTSVGGLTAVVTSEERDDTISTPQLSDEISEEPNWNHEKMYEVLQGLPEPPQVDGMDIHEAHSKLSAQEFRLKIIKLWKDRQALLKEAIDSMQDDGKHIAQLLEQLQEAEREEKTERVLEVLEVLEWEVQDLDKTHVFNFLGGFQVIARLLESSNLSIRAHASWLVGTAVKNYKHGQDWAIDAGVIPPLVNSLSYTVSDSGSDVWEVQKKAVYALSSLIRFNERGQRLFLSLGGPAKLATIVDSSEHPISVRLKAVLVAHDLLHETPPAVVEDTNNDQSLQQLQAIFKSSDWCTRIAAFVNENSSRLQVNHLLELLHMMQLQLPVCQTEFTSLNIKPTVEDIATSLKNKEELEADERQELMPVVDRLLSRLP